MVLSVEDSALFYKIYLALLDFVNTKYKVDKKIGKMEGAEMIDPNIVKKIADKLWENTSVIDEYLLMYGATLSQEHTCILESWKRRVCGKFLLERHLKSGSIFISMEDEEVYLVKGIISSWEEMLWYMDMPIMLSATFIPFKDVIISDGHVMPYNIHMGSGIKKRLKEVYSDAKKYGNLHTTL